MMSATGRAAHAIRCFRQIRLKVLYMTRRQALVVITAIAYLFAPQGSALAQNTLPPAAKPLPLLSPIFGHNMVLQRGKVNTIWGWSDPGDQVWVEIAGKRAFGIAGADRRWQVKIQPPPAGGPYTVEIAALKPWNSTMFWLGTSGCVAANPICR